MDKPYLIKVQQRILQTGQWGHGWQQLFSQFLPRQLRKNMYIELKQAQPADIYGVRIQEEETELIRLEKYEEWP